MSSQYCTFSSLVIFYKSILSACKNKQNHRHRNIFYVCVHAIFRQAVKCNRTPAKQKHKSRTKPKRGERISINCTRPKCGCRNAIALQWLGCRAVTPWQPQNHKRHRPFPKRNVRLGKGRMRIGGVRFERIRLTILVS